jgi:hypothetical protein
MHEGPPHVFCRLQKHMSYIIVTAPIHVYYHYHNRDFSSVPSIKRTTK